MNDCAQDIHIDLMHVLYVYSRVMGEGGGGIITKYGRGADICSIVDIYKTHAVQ